MRRRGLAALVLTFLVLSGGCYGSFAVTREVYRHNDHVDGQAAREGVFLALIIIPVYEAAVLADLLVFNTVELLSGHNPLDDRITDDEARP
jgi:hypothetical protein